MYHKTLAAPFLVGRKQRPQLVHLGRLGGDICWQKQHVLVASLNPAGRGSAPSGFCIVKKLDVRSMAVMDNIVFGVVAEG